MKVTGNGAEVENRFVEPNWWIVEVESEWQTVSDKELTAMRTSGRSVRVLHGPYKSNEDARYELDVFWEAPE